MHEARDNDPQVLTEIAVIASSDYESLSAQLRYAGFRAHQRGSLEEGEALISGGNVAAAIVQVDIPNSKRNGIEMLAQLRASGISLPVLFVTARDDPDTRLAAVEAGGNGYFNLPLDTAGLLAKLDGLLYPASVQPWGGVLVIADAEQAAQSVVTALRRRGIDNVFAAQPRSVFEVLRTQRPDVIVVDLGLKSFNPVTFVKALRQHHHCYPVPMLLLCDPANRSRYLSELQGASDELVEKPLNGDYLGWLVQRRLQRNRAITTRIDDLRQRDNASGLYHRAYFLDQLRYHLENDGSRIAVMLLALDGLRALASVTERFVSDTLLSQVAGRLRLLLEPGTLIARFDESHLAVLVKSALSDDGLTKLAERLRARLGRDDYYTGGREFVADVQTGIVVTIPPQDGIAVLEAAVEACVQARKSSTAVYLTRFTGQARRMPKQISEQTLEALDQNRLQLLFHPIDHLEDSVQRYEVLLRLHDADQLELPTNDVFVAAQQQQQLGSRLDRQVLSQCLAQMTDNPAQEAKKTRLFINLTPASVLDPAFADWLIKRLLECPQLTPDTLVLTFPETLAWQYSQQFRVLINRLACEICLKHVSLPDKIAALSAQWDWAPDYAMLDPQIIKSLQSGRSNAQTKSYLESIVRELARKTTVIATGVEDLRILPALWSSGIKCLQGFALQRPQQYMDYDFDHSAH